MTNPKQQKSTRSSTVKLIPYYYFLGGGGGGVLIALPPTKWTQANKQIDSSHCPINLQKAHGFGFVMTSGATVLQNFIMEESVV